MSSIRFSRLPAALAACAHDPDRSTMLPSALFEASPGGRCTLRSVGVGCCHLVIGLRPKTGLGLAAQSPGRGVLDPSAQAAFACAASYPSGW